MAVRHLSDHVATSDSEPVNAPVTRPAALPLSDQYLRLLIESATDYAIFGTDPQRRVSSWNTGAQRMFGYTEAEIIGQSGDIIFIPEDRAKGAPQQEAETALRQSRAEDERWHLRKGGERFYASGVMSPVYTSDGTHLGFLKIARDLTQRKLAEDGLRIAREQLEERVRQRTAELHTANAALRTEVLQRREAESSRQELLKRIGTAQEEERLRISRELHDEIGQHLAALMLGLNSLEPAVASSPHAPVLTKLQQLTETIGREVHALAVQLRPTALDDLGLLRAISTYLELWSSRSGVKADLHASSFEEVRLPANLELALYRIVQEALTNVMKHANATRVSLILTRQNQEAVAIIEDDGRGFDPDAHRASDSKGLGLLGMRERAAQLNGHVTVESELGHGTTLFVRLPIP